MPYPGCGAAWRGRCSVDGGLAGQASRSQEGCQLIAGVLSTGGSQIKQQRPDLAPSHFQRDVFVGDLGRTGELNSRACNTTVDIWSRLCYPNNYYIKAPPSVRVPTPLVYSQY